MTRRHGWGALFTLGGACALALHGCKDDAHGYEHAEEHPEGHDHHEQGHGHDGEAVVRVTRWGSAHELFAEHPPAVTGQKVTLLAHLTVLEGFRALDGGNVRLELEGPVKLEASAAQPLRPGIYALEFVAPAPGQYRGRLVIEGGAPGVIDGLALQVFANAEQGEAAASDDEDEGLIELLKEQQWGVAFGTAFVETGALVASIQVAGVVETPPGGMAEVGAPVAGRLVVPAQGLARPGERVKKGQLLASMVPAPASPEDAARVNLAVAEAQSRAAAARAALERAERLIADQAIAQRELDDARREASLAAESVQAAARAAEAFSGASAGSGAGSWRLLAPIDGTLTRVSATPGAAVSPGEVLFEIVDDRELWIRTRVPEQDAARLRADRDAHYQVAGLDSWQPIDVTGADATASVVSVGRTVDPVARTVDVIHALHTPDPALRVGGMVQVSLPAGDDFSGVVVPDAAVVVDEGRAVVFVQVDGEHFVERPVRLGPRAGERVGVEHGLAAGERIVVRGAHLVRLADRASSAQPHGHIH